MNGPEPAAPLRARLARLAPHLLVFVLAFVILRLALPQPRLLTADEVDALRGGRHLVDLMTTPEYDPRLGDGSGLRGRLKVGFATFDNPRSNLLPDSTARRSAVEPPVPRWLAALGIGVLPVSEDATNLARASVASTLALAFALALMTWAFRRRGWVSCGFLALGALGLNGFFDAAASAGSAASAFLAMSLFLVALERLVETGRGTLLVGATLGLTLGVHPFAVALVVVVFCAWAIRRGSGVYPSTGQLPLPSAPLGLFAIPVVALVVLVLIWPALWNETGSRLGAWLIDLGSTRSLPHEVLGLAWDQGSNRAGQAWTAALQWVSWTPLPILFLWAIGLARAIRLRRAGLWVPPLTVFALLFAGALDGGLFGGRLSLLALLWAPTLITAADGFVGFAGFVARRAELIAGWPRALAGPRLTALLVVMLLGVPLLQAARGTSVGLARTSGSELRFAVPLALLDRAAELVPGATIHVQPWPTWYRPAIDVARRDLEGDLGWGELDEADFVVVVGEVPPELGPTLADEVARDLRPGPVTTLWRVRVAPNTPNPSGPGGLDKRPTLPH